MTTVERIRALDAAAQPGTAGTQRRYLYRCQQVLSGAEFELVLRAYERQAAGGTPDGMRAEEINALAKAHCDADAWGLFCALARRGQGTIEHLRWRAKLEGARVLYRAGARAAVRRRPR